MKRLFLTAAVAVGLMSASAAADMIRVQSNHDVSTTIDRLAAAVEGAGAKVFARVDHAAGAASVDQELAPATLLIFGNPKLGTPAMQSGITMGLDLPLRVLAYQQDGKTWMIYHDPMDVGTSHGLDPDHPVIAKMTGALGKLTAKAAE